MSKKSNRVPAVLYIVLSSIGLFIWLGLLFFAFFLGGSPGPGYERGVPYLYAAIMILGFLGAIISLTSGIKGINNRHVGKLTTVCAAVIGAIGSIPLFLMELNAVGLFALAASVLPSALYLILLKKSDTKGGRP